MPPVCLVCDRRIKPNEFICHACYDQLEFAKDPDVQVHFNECFQQDKNCAKLLTLFIFKKDSAIQSLLHQIKYQKRFKLAVSLGRIFAERHLDCLKSHKVDFIVPVPLYHSKKAERGFNQSFYFAKGIKDIINIPVNEHVLKRIKFTGTQTQLNKFERKENVKGAFKCVRVGQISGKKILLVDDVLTTGSTMSECALVLKNAGAHKIIAATIAIA